MVRCRNGALYTGITTDIDRRLREHNTGKGAKYTRLNGPVELVYLEAAADRGGAQARERFLKRLPRSKKLSLIGESANLMTWLANAEGQGDGR